MKCNNCNNKDLAFVEETFDKRKSIVNVITAAAIIVCCIVVFVTAKSDESLNEFFKYFCISLIPTIFVATRIYLFVKIKTSRTKNVVCGGIWRMTSQIQSM